VLARLSHADTPYTLVGETGSIKQTPAMLQVIAETKAITMGVDDLPLRK
jgi:hypothetical protein